MSVEEIVKYVRQTPGNTNPSVIASMVNAEMNSTLEEAKKYTDSQRLAYTEKKVLTYDGNPDGRIELTNGTFLAKISNDEIDLTSVKKVHCTHADGHIEVFDAGSGALSVIEQDEYTKLLVTFISEGEGIPLMIVSTNNDSMYGTYAIAIEPSVLMERNAYTSYVEFETVHQIDPKFIPGVTLPVINYEDYFNIDFISAIMAGAMAGTEKPFFIDNLVKPEFAENFTPTTPVVVIKIKATQEDRTADIYCFARACFNNGDPTLIRINDSFYYNDSIVNFDIYALAHGAGFTQIKAQNVTYPD